MKRVNYEPIAWIYDRRYQTNRFDGVRLLIGNFLDPASFLNIIEIGCGTGHWLSGLHATSGVLVGLDPSPAMLHTAQKAAPHARLARGRAEHPPFVAKAFDRVFCINALDHFDDPKAFVQQARRILRPEGGLLNIGLDPHSGLDQWWIYDYFPDALSADRARYLSTATIRTMFQEAGFAPVSTSVAQHIPTAVPFNSAVEQGLLDRASTSQLQVIDDDHWRQGRAKLQAEQPVLRADLRLWATVGWLTPEAHTPGA